jgi:iron complex outermembrane recepter protein
MYNKQGFLLRFTAAAVILGAPGIVLSATVDATLAAASPAAATGDTSAQSEPASAAPALEEITVTAQRRSENLQDVPISVAVVTAATLETYHELSTRDLQFNAPSLVYNEAATNAQPYIRGVGSDLEGPNLDPAVATYVDGVYLSNSSSTISNMFGIDNVQVLAGPQGTLFGRNALGGAIVVQTLTPSNQFDARASGTYGNYNERDVTAYVSGPLVDQLSAGLYVMSDRRDTYLRDWNPTDPKEEVRKGIRAKAVWTPTDFIKLTASAEYTDYNGVEGAALRNIQPNALGYVFGATSPIQPYVYDADYRQFVDNNMQTYSLHEDVNLGWAKVVGISAAHRLSQENANDLDGTNAALLADTGANYSNQLSQELQLLSPDGSKITWIVGAYYSHERTGYYPTGIVSGVPGIVFPAPIGASLTTATVLIDSWAGFAQVTAPLDFLAQGLRLTLGGRFSSDHKSFGAFGQLLEGYEEQGPQIGSTTVYPNSAANWTKFTPKIVLDYKVSNTLLYASYSQGYQAGAYNIASPGDPGPVNPETLDAYEIGTKSEFFDKRIRLNTAAYYYNIKDLQVQLVDVTATSTTSLENAATAEAYGFEAQLTAQATQNLQFTSSLALEHATYISFPNAASNDIGPLGNPSAEFNASGNDLERTPKIIYSVGVDYNYPLANGGSLDANTKWYHNGGFFWEPTDRFRQDDYTLGNVSLAYKFPDKRLTVQGYVTNVTNKNYQNILLLVPTSIDISDAPPRQYGVTVSWKY